MARFEEVINIRPQTAETGAVSGLMSLSQKLEQFQNVQNQITSGLLTAAGKQAEQRGVETGQKVILEKEKGITKAPKFKKKRFIGSIEINAHNKALRAAYLSSINNDIREGVAKIQTENPDNLINFNESVSSFAKGMINTVDPSVRELVSGALDERITTGRIAVQSADIKKQNDIAFQELQESAKNTEDSAILAAQGGDLQTAGLDLLYLDGILQAQVDAGFITEPEAREKKRDAELRATQSSLIGSVRQLTDTGQFGKALKVIEKTRSELPKNMSIEEHSDIVQGMISDVNRSINIRNKIESQEQANIEAGQVAKYNDLFIGLIEGTTMSEDITRQLRNKKITVPQANALVNTLNNRGFGVDDWPLIGSIQEDIRNGVNPNDIRNNIITNSGSRLTEQTATTLISSLNESLDTESVLNTSQVKRARAFITPSIRVTGPLGALDTQAERRLAGALREFDERVLAGEDAFSVADELVGKDEFERAPNPMFGTKMDLDKAQEQLNAARLSQQIDADTYNFEEELIIRLKKLKVNIDAFNAVKKDLE